MSRSRKKTFLFHGVEHAIKTHPKMKEWKTQVNRELRRLPIELDLKDYKKRSEIWDSPKDGRWFTDDPKEIRK